MSRQTPSASKAFYTVPTQEPIPLSYPSLLPQFSLCWKFSTSVFSGHGWKKGGDPLQKPYPNTRARSLPLIRIARQQRSRLRSHARAFPTSAATPPYPPAPGAPPPAPPSPTLNSVRKKRLLQKRRAKNRVPDLSFHKGGESAIVRVTENSPSYSPTDSALIPVTKRSLDWHFISFEHIALFGERDCKHCHEAALCHVCILA